MASYLYYYREVSLFSDSYFDYLCTMLIQHWTMFEHRHKALILQTDLESGSLYRLKESDYPTICRDTAQMLARQL